MSEAVFSYGAKLILYLGGYFSRLLDSLLS
jgi:hypothetical protein